MTKGNMETEIKLEVTHLEVLRDKILSLGFVVEVNRAFEDNWVFDFLDGRLREQRCLFRMREYNGKTTVTYKAASVASEHFKIREELETEVGDRFAFYQILERLGMQLTFRYQKYRTEFIPAQNDEAAYLMLTLDETPIGNYMEIEGSKSDIVQVATALGFAPEGFIRDSYLALYLKMHPESKEMRMVFPAAG
jgi:adenylate cyclase class 2